jgi:archaellum component FlaG (FlaF/FlaG flagellin family)
MTKIYLILFCYALLITSSESAPITYVTEHLSNTTLDFETTTTIPTLPENALTTTDPSTNLTLGDRFVFDVPKNCGDREKYNVQEGQCRKIL